ncbi:unnamed protein product, partial [Prorocentrum cordatum]
MGRLLQKVEEAKAVPAVTVWATAATSRAFLEPLGQQVPEDDEEARNAARRCAETHQAATLAAKRAKVDDAEGPQRWLVSLQARLARPLLLLLPRPPVEAIIAPDTGHEDVAVLCGNITEWGPRVQGFLQSDRVKRFDGVACVELRRAETHSRSIIKAFRKDGWKATHSPGVSTGKDGVAGVELMVVRAPLQATTFDHWRDANGAAHCGYAPMILRATAGNIIAVALYLHPALGFGKRDRDTLVALGAFLALQKAPWIVLGDWNHEPHQLAQSGWVAKLGGAVIAPDVATTRDKELGRLLDYGLAKDGHQHFSLKAFLKAPGDALRAPARPPRRLPEMVVSGAGRPAQPPGDRARQGGSGPQYSKRPRQRHAALQRRAAALPAELGADFEDVQLGRWRGCSEGPPASGPTAVLPDPRQGPAGHDASPRPAPAPADGGGSLSAAQAGLDQFHDCLASPQDPPTQDTPHGFASQPTAPSPPQGQAPRDAPTAPFLAPLDTWLGATPCRHSDAQVHPDLFYHPFLDEREDQAHAHAEPYGRRVAQVKAAILRREGCDKANWAARQGRARGVGVAWSHAAASPGTAHLHHPEADAWATRSANLAAILALAASGKDYRQLLRRLDLHRSTLADIGKLPAAKRTDQLAVDQRRATVILDQPRQEQAAARQLALDLAGDAARRAFQHGRQAFAAWAAKATLGQLHRWTKDGDLERLEDPAEGTLADPVEVMLAKTTTWQWQKVWTAPADRTKAIPVALASFRVLAAQEALEPIAADCLNAATGKPGPRMACRKAQGVDRLSPLDVERFPDCAKEQFLAVLHQAGAHCMWPPQLNGTLGAVAGKLAGGDRVLGLLPMPVRIWARARSGVVDQWTQGLE